MSDYKKKQFYRDIEKIHSMIANDPSMDSVKLLSIAKNMGYDNPGPLIDAALGSVKLDKSGVPIKADIEDILNEVYSEDITPGKRYIVNPYKESAVGTKAKSVIKNLQDEFGDVDQGVALREAQRVRGRAAPKYIAVPDPSFYKDYYNLSDELAKLSTISGAGHELGHSKDWMLYPNFDPKVSSPYKKGHHAKGIFEPDELIREVRDLPVDEKIAKELAKQSDNLKVKPSKFVRLRSLIGFLPALAAGVIGAYAPQSKAATVAKTISRATDEGDPFSALFPPEAGEGEEDELKKMRKEAEYQQKLKETIKPMVKEVGGDPDINPRKAEKLLGEKVSEDVEDDTRELSRENYDKMLKRKMGF